MLPEIERAQQDVEAQQVGEHEPNVLRQEQVVDVDCLAQRFGACVFRGGLVCRHSAEHRVHPSCHLARLFLVLGHFPAKSFARG